MPGQSVAPPVAGTPEAVRGFPKEAKAHTPANSGTGAMFASKFANMIYVGVAGHVSLVREDGTQVQFKNMTAGEFRKVLPFIRVSSDNTTATDIVVGIAFK